MKDYLKSNEALWDEWARIHPDTAMYNMPAFLSGATSLKSIEREALGDVGGKQLLHLQCHFGQDTLSWARLGAEAVGVDFSQEAIKIARQLNEELGLSAAFLQSDVLQLSGKLQRQFDIVFTSYGVLNWLPELDSWGEVVAEHLKPGGRFYIVEFHPAFYMFDHEGGNYAYSYFNQGVPYTEQVEGSYAKLEEGRWRTEHSWSHSLADIMGALLRQGLVLEAFEEYPYSPYNCFPNMEAVEPGRYQCRSLPGVPHLFSLKMRKP